MLEAASFGVHIHEGTSCESHDIVGGHYYGGESDPWTAVTNAMMPYSLDGSVTYEYMFTPEEVAEYGYNNGGTVGHVVVVHDATGSRIGCGELKQMMSGIHIHDGKCASVKGHYYNSDVYTASDEPWIPIKWGPTSGSESTGSVRVDTGYESKTYDEQSVVVHYGANKVLCSNLVKAEYDPMTGGCDPPIKCYRVESFGTYPGENAASEPYKSFEAFEGHFSVQGPANGRLVY